MLESGDTTVLKIGKILLFHLECVWDIHYTCKQTKKRTYLQVKMNAMKKSTGYDFRWKMLGIYIRLEVRMTFLRKRVYAAVWRIFTCLAGTYDGQIILGRGGRMSKGPEVRRSSVSWKNMISKRIEAWERLKGSKGSDHAGKSGGGRVPGQEKVAKWMEEGRGE